MVLIILATISINAVIGQDGIIQKAKDAKTYYLEKEKEEKTKMQELTNELALYYPDKNSGGNSEVKNEESGGEITILTAGTVVAKPGNWDSTKVTPIADGNGGTVPLPDGFYYVDGDYDTGLIISDKQGDTKNSSGTSMGNQFVWIPATEADLTRTNFDSNGKPTTDAPSNGQNVTVCSEPLTSGGYLTEASEYNTMKAQVIKYGGFYIGRFEAGVNSTTLRTKVTTNQTVVCKRDVAPYNYIPWGQSANDINTVFVPTSGNTDNVSTNGAVYLSKKFVRQKGYTSVTSTLIYGCQWDAMCRYIGDSQRNTPKKSAPELTGSVTGDVSKNIYDLAGNCIEWTMEANGTTLRVIRGGYYDSDFPISVRDKSNSPTNSVAYYGFRVTLYIKQN